MCARDRHSQCTPFVRGASRSIDSRAHSAAKQENIMSKHNPKLTAHQKHEDAFEEVAEVDLDQVNGGDNGSTAGWSNGSTAGWSNGSTAGWSNGSTAGWSNGSR
jgi:rSAM-associated Gly-rich repeat protein